MKKLYRSLLFMVTTLLLPVKYSSAQSLLNSQYILDSCESSGMLSLTYGGMLKQQTVTGFSVMMYFGDGSSKLIDPLPSSFYNEHHYYSLPGTYTLKQVLFENGIPKDSMDTTYAVGCRVVKLRIFGDINSNCTKDASENNYYFAYVEVDSAGVIIDTIAVGGVKAYRPKGQATYKFRAITLQPGMLLSCTSSTTQTAVIGSNWTSHTLDYGVYCDPNAQFDLSGEVTGRFRPVAKSYISVSAINYSCDSVDATMTLQIDPKYQYSAASITPASVSGNTLTWNLTNVSSYHNPPINVEVTPATTVSAGDSVCNILTVTPTSGDANPANNTIVRCARVIAAFDPNDKSVTPEGEIAAGTTLTYHINFENLGDDTAFNIYVLDTLSTFLNPGSLKVLSSSHRMVFDILEIGNLNIARFEFNDIKLEDKSAPLRNKGYVRFTIDVKKNTPKGISIKNRAGIYFDVNPVVMTNTVTNIIPLSIKNIAAPDEMKIYPNPVNDMLTVETTQNNYHTLRIMNNIGQSVITQNVIGSTTNISLKGIPAGIYVVQIIGEEQILTQKIEKL